MLVQNDFGVWQIDLTVDGQRCRKSTRTKDKKLAEKIHALTEAEMIKGKFGLAKKKKYTLSEAFEDCYEAIWRGKKSDYRYRQNWELIKEYLSDSLGIDEVNQEVISELRKSLKKIGSTGATINRKLALVRALLNWCKKEGKLATVPYIALEDEAPPRHRELSPKEETDMMSFFGTHPVFFDRLPLFEFLLNSGNRLSEALKIEWTEVDFNNNRVRFKDTKSGADVFKPMTDTMRRILKSQQGLPRPFPFKIRACEAAWERFREFMNYQDDPAFVIHSLRHTCGSRLAASGVDLLRIQAWLGHESYETTLRYAQITPSHLQDVVKSINSNNQFDYSLSSVSQTAVPSSVRPILQS
jgi:integrase